jgi:hypothetical protein
MRVRKKDKSEKERGERVRKMMAGKKDEGGQER